jgi:transcriptional regulator with XRE-family HTH domain
MLNLKETIESKYGSVNKFCDQIDRNILSKQTVYKLMNNTKPNPTLTTLIALSKYLEVDLVEIVMFYKNIQEGAQL